MFTVDFAEDFSGLTHYQISGLETKGIITPQKERGTKYYTYGDIYVLRVFKILQRAGIRHINISDAFEYLKSMDESKPLSSFLLLHDRKNVYTILDGNEISASKWGQLILQGTIEMIALGTELEQTRQRMNKYFKGLKSASKRASDKGKVFSVEELRKLA